MDKIILIGGAPTAGKSYTAKKIAKSLDLSWISTDMIREYMKKIVRKEDYPAIFYHTESTQKSAVNFLSNNTAKEIVKINNKESADVWKGVKSFIEADEVWESFIIEGVAILPKLVSRLSIKDKKIISIFLVDDDIERIRKTIFTRGLWDDAHKYPDHVKEKEVEWVVEFNKYIVREAKKFKLPIVKIGNRIKYLDQIKRLVK